MAKYGNVRSGKYASKAEAKRGAELRLLEKAGKIRELREQEKFTLLPRQFSKSGKLLEREVTYTCDYAYRDSTGDMVVEDCKGVRTQQYILRRKLMLWVHNIRVIEV